MPKLAIWKRLKVYSRKTLFFPKKTTSERFENSQAKTPIETLPRKKHATNNINIADQHNFKKLFPEKTIYFSEETQLFEDFENIPAIRSLRLILDKKCIYLASLKKFAVFRISSSILPKNTKF